MPTTPYNFIDSSLDYDEGWSTFGTRGGGSLPMLQEGVGGLGALASEPQAFRLFSNLDQRVILDEIDENPGFGKVLTAALHTPGGEKAIVASAQRAILNELNPKEFPDSKGKWITLRRRLRVILRDLPADIQRHVDKMSLAQKTAVLNAIAHGGEVSLQLEDVDIGSIIGSVVSSAATAAGAIYKTKIEQSTVKQVANIQAQSAANTAAAQAQLQQAQAALAAAQGGGAGGGGTLMWAVPLGLGVLGLVIWLVMRSSR